jgi:23S rRNA pseudouridine1911/1915/1917 synthase
MRSNLGYEYRHVLGSDADGATLAEYLTNRFPHSSAEAWRRRIHDRRVLLDGAQAHPDQAIRRGQCLVWRRPGWVEPEVPRGYATIYRDADLLAVAKPAGLPSLPGGGYLENTLLHLVRERDPGAVPLHRLGRWTSGLVLFALSDVARSRVSRAWREQKVVKRYLGLASGMPSLSEFEVSCPIGLVPYGPLGRLYAASPAGKPSSSHVRVLELRGHGFLAGITIGTGRPHQIRIHLAAAGHPLVGDPLYGPGGAPREGTRALPGDPGYRLHASELLLAHPTRGDRVVLSCPPPEQLSAATRGSAAGSWGPEPA